MDTYKYYKFDMSEENLLKTGKFTEKNVKDAWQIVAIVFDDIGYYHAQESGYQSRVCKSTANAEKDIESMCLRIDWFPEALDKLNLTDIIEYKDMRDITTKFCQGKGVRPDKNDVKEKRCFTYDLSYVNLTQKGYPDVIGLTEVFGENNESRAYEKLGEALKENGFEWVQNSAWVSKEEMTEKQMLDAYKAICKKCPWLYKVAKNVEMSIRGEQIEQDTLNYVKSFKPDDYTIKRLSAIRDDMFLTLSTEKKKVYCYAHDEENDKYYKYRLSDYGIGSQAYTVMMSTSVDIMDGMYNTSRAEEVTVEEYKEAVRKNIDALQRIDSENTSFDFAFTRENVGLLVSELMSPHKAMLKELNIAFTAEKQRAIKDFELELLEPPKVKKLHKNESWQLFKSVSSLLDERVKDLSANRDFVPQEKKQNLSRIRHWRMGPKGNIYRNSDSSRMWTAARDMESRKDGVVALQYEVPLPRNLDLRGKEEAVKRFAQEMFVKHGHMVEAFIESDRNDISKMKAVFVVSDRRIEGGRFAKAKQQTVEKDGKKFILKYGVDNRLAKFHLQTSWLKTLNEVEQEHGGKKQYIFSRHMGDFLEYVKEKKAEKGKNFVKKKLSVRGFLKKSWKERESQFTLSSERS